MTTDVLEYTFQVDVFFFRYAATTTDVLEYTFQVQVDHSTLREIVALREFPLFETIWLEERVLAECSFSLNEDEDVIPNDPTPTIWKKCCRFGDMGVGGCVCGAEVESCETTLPVCFHPSAAQSSRRERLRLRRAAAPRSPLAPEAGEAVALKATERSLITRYAPSEQ